MGQGPQRRGEVHLPVSEQRGCGVQFRYEQAVLKQFAEPLLYSITKDEPEYYEAKRLLKFLDYFVGVDTAMVPANSICREFVGGGCFPV